MSSETKAARGMCRIAEKRTDGSGRAFPFSGMSREFTHLHLSAPTCALHRERITLWLSSFRRQIRTCSPPYLDRIESASLLPAVQAKMGMGFGSSMSILDTDFEYVAGHVDARLESFTRCLLFTVWLNHLAMVCHHPDAHQLTLAVRSGVREQNPNRRDGEGLTTTEVRPLLTLYVNRIRNRRVRRRDWLDQECP